MTKQEQRKAIVIQRERIKDSGSLVMEIIEIRNKFTLSVAVFVEDAGRLSGGICPVGHCKCGTGREREVRARQ